MNTEQKAQLEKAAKGEPSLLTTLAQVALQQAAPIPFRAPRSVLPELASIPEGQTIRTWQEHERARAGEPPIKYLNRRVELRERMAEAMRKADLKDGEGNTYRLFDLLDFSGENKAHLVTYGLVDAVLGVLDAPPSDDGKGAGKPAFSDPSRARARTRDELANLLHDWRWTDLDVAQEDAPAILDRILDVLLSACERYPYFAHGPDVLKAVKLGHIADDRKEPF